MSPSGVPSAIYRTHSTSKGCKGVTGPQTRALRQRGQQCGVSLLRKSSPSASSLRVLAPQGCWLLTARPGLGSVGSEAPRQAGLDRTRSAYYLRVSPGSLQSLPALLPPPSRQPKPLAFLTRSQGLHHRFLEPERRSNSSVFYGFWVRPNAQWRGTPRPPL